MTQKRFQIFLLIALLIGLLGGYYCFVVMAGSNNQTVQTPTTQAIPEIFGVKANLPSGWTQEVKESLKQEGSEQETIEYKKDSFVITVNIKLTKKAPTSQVYTGYIPETREYLTTSNSPEKLGLKDKVNIGRVKTDKGYALVDLDSVKVEETSFNPQAQLVTREYVNKFIYELPVIVSKEGYETKTVINYDLSDQPNLLEEADKIILSLNSN